MVWAGTISWGTWGSATCLAKIIHPSSSRSSLQGKGLRVGEGWSLSQLSLGERRGTPWIGHQPNTGLTQRDRTNCYPVWFILQIKVISASVMHISQPDMNLLKLNRLYSKYRSDIVVGRQSPVYRLGSVLSQRCSIQLRWGLCAGQSSSTTPNLLMQCFVDLALCSGVQEGATPKLFQRSWEAWNRSKCLVLLKH